MKKSSIKITIMALALVFMLMYLIGSAFDDQGALMIIGHIYLAALLLMMFIGNQ